MKIDYNTDNRAQGKFARMKILIDLWKPLIYNITIKDKIQRVEYKGLLNDYFEGDNRGGKLESGGRKVWAINVTEDEKQEKFQERVWEVSIKLR
ncbi:hypothetical protein Gotur_016447 [Gossypium turneri]